MRFAGHLAGNNAETGSRPDQVRTEVVSYPEGAEQIEHRYE